MSRFFLSAVAGVLTLALTSPAHAHGHGHAGGMRSPSISHNSSSFRSPNNHSFVQRYGRRMSHGYAFNSRNFYWNSRCWSGRYGCYCYWNPYVNSWYYWCGPQSCYYPLSYITIAPPTVVVAPPTVAVVPPGVGGPAGPGGSMPPSIPPVP